MHGFVQFPLFHRPVISNSNSNSNSNSIGIQSKQTNQSAAKLDASQTIEGNV